MDLILSLRNWIGGVIDFQNVLDDDERFEDIPKSLTKVHEGKQTAAKNISLAVTAALAYRLQHRTAR